MREIPCFNKGTRAHLYTLTGVCALPSKLKQIGVSAFVFNYGAKLLSSNFIKERLVAVFSGSEPFCIYSAKAYLPINRISPLVLSRIAKIERFIKFKLNGSGGSAEPPIPIDVTAAASVPFSSTLINVLWIVSVNHILPESNIFSNRAVLVSKAVLMPMFLSVSLRRSEYSILNFGIESFVYVRSKFCHW